MAIITYPLNGVQYLAEDAETYLSTRQSGVYSSDDHFSASVVASREIEISPGLAWINNGQFKGKSIAVTEPVTVTVPMADGALDRRDLIVLRFDALANSSSFVVKTGVPSGSPAVPSVERNGIYELGLYSVTVPAASTEVSATNIESLILDENYCGVMRDGVTAIPTAHIQEQAEALMELLRESAGTIIAADAEMISNGGDPSITATLIKTTNGVSLKFKFINIRPRRGVDYLNDADYDVIDNHIRKIVVEGEW